MNWKQKQEHEKEAQRQAEFYDAALEPQIVPGVQHCILPIAHQGEHLCVITPSNIWRCDKIKRED